MAQEAGLHVDLPGFQAAMEEAKELSRAGEENKPSMNNVGASTRIKIVGIDAKTSSNNVHGC